MKRKPRQTAGIRYSVAIHEFAPMHGQSKGHDFLENYYENEGDNGIGSTHGNQYDYMKSEDPCATCKSKPYCAESNAICLAFAEYVDEGSFKESNRGKPEVGGYDKMLATDRSLRRGGTWTKSFYEDN